MFSQNINNYNFPFVGHKVKADNFWTRTQLHFFSIMQHYRLQTWNRQRKAEKSNFPLPIDNRWLTTSIDKFIESLILPSFAHDEEFPQRLIIFKTIKCITARICKAERNETKILIVCYHFYHFNTTKIEIVFQLLMGSKDDSSLPVLTLYLLTCFKTC